MQKQTRATSETDPTTGKPNTARSPGPKDAGPKGACSGACSDACQCGYFDGHRITYTDTNSATGETEQKSFRKPSRKLVCPHCGGHNEKYRRSYTAHVASIARSYRTQRGAHKGIVWDVSLCLDADAVTASEVGEEASVAVWFRYLWPRLRKRLKRADPNATYIGTASAQLSNGRYHFHLVVFTTLPGYRIRELLHRDPGVNCYVQCPGANESNEQFAARRAAYAWDNAARAARSALDSDARGYRFTASQGIGYTSASAKEKRLEAFQQSVIAAQEGDPQRNASSALVEERGQNEVERSQRGHDTRGNSKQWAPDRPPSTRKPPPGSDASPVPDREEPTAPPVKYGEDGHPVRVSSHRAAVDRVRVVLMRYVGQSVHVWGRGACRVLSVGVQRVEGCELAITVHPKDTDRTVAVPWTEIRCQHPPIIRTVSPQPPTSTPKPMSNATEHNAAEHNEKGNQDEHADDIERFLAAARYSTVTVEQPDGTRVKTRKDHKTGEVTETVLPPKENA